MALGHWADELDMATKSLLLDRELAELTGRCHVVRQPDKAEPKSPTRSSRRIFADRWRMLADLRWPSPGGGERPKSASGATSFHMRVTGWSRPADGTTAAGIPSSGGGHRAASFDVYVTDELAPAQIDGAGFDRYAADRLSPDDPEVEPGSRVAFIITNIDDDPDKRTTFWEARDRAARRRGDPIVEFVPGRGSIEQWRALEGDRTLPSRVRDAVTSIVSKLAAEPAAGGRKTRIGKQRIRLESDAEIAWAARLRDRFGVQKTQRMLHYVRPRGGQVQQRFEVEIPTGLELAEALQIARELATLVGRLKLPFVIAVHRPDADNDPRNWHLHLLYHPHPGERDSDGIWAFGKAANGEGVLRPGDIARTLKGDDTVARNAWFKSAAGADLRALREAYAAICNAVLERVGDRRRLDPRSYEMMGIAKRPERHLGTTEARLFFAGVATATSRFNATRDWEWILRQRQAKIDGSYARLLAPLEAQRAIVDADDDLRRRRDRLVAERDALAADRRELALVDARLEIVRSSAKRVKENCERTLERIAMGDASQSDVRSEAAIRARLRLAEHHLIEIADAVEPWLDPMEAFRRDLDQREQALRAGVDACVEQARQQDRTGEMAQPIRDAEATGIAEEHVLPVEPAAVETPAPDRPAEAVAVSGSPLSIDRKERLEIDRLLAAVRANGLANTRDATRGTTSTPRADAVLFQRYHDHPYFVARRASAERDWSEKIMRESDDIARRVAAMVAPPSVPPPSQIVVADVDSMPALSAVQQPSVAIAADDRNSVAEIAVAATSMEEPETKSPGADCGPGAVETRHGDERVQDRHEAPVEVPAGKSDPLSTPQLPSAEPLMAAPVAVEVIDPQDARRPAPNALDDSPAEPRQPARTALGERASDIRAELVEQAPATDAASAMAHGKQGVAEDSAGDRPAPKTPLFDRAVSPEETTDVPTPVLPAAAAQDEIAKAAPSTEPVTDPAVVKAEQHDVRSTEPVEPEQSAGRRTSIMDIVRAATKGREGNSATKDPPRKKGMPARNAAQTGPSVPVQAPPVNKAPAPRESPDPLEQQIQWAKEREKGSGR